MVKINEEVTYFRDTGQPHNGFYIDGYLKDNIDNFMVKAVESKFDCVVCISGSEGSGKTTIASTIANYVDPTFPGEPLNDGTPRRHCERIVFDHDQIMEAIDKAKPKQAIVIDEAVLSMFSQDFSGELQKVLIKKFVTIRKKRLFIFLVIPSVFMLRKYFAIFRTRACVHCRVDEGVKRGTFNFYSYNTKRQLWIRGIKEFDQSIVQPDFSGVFTDTNGFFFDPEEYDQKKEEAIKNLSREQNKEEKNENGKDISFDTKVSEMYSEWCIRTGRTNIEEFLVEFNRKFGTSCDKTWLKSKLNIVNKAKLIKFFEENHSK